MRPEDSQQEPVADPGVERSTPRQGGAFRKLVLYGFSRTVAQGLVSTKGILLASLLGPERFGVWALFRLAMLYGSFGSLGVFRGLELEVAQSQIPGGSALDGTRKSFCGAALSLTLAISGAVGLVSLVASLLVDNPDLITVLRVFGVGLFLESVVVYAMTYLRAAGELRAYAFAEVGLAMAHLALAVVLALRWGLGGAFLGYLLATLLVLPFFVRRVPFHPGFSIAESRRLVQVGFPIAMTSILGFAMTGVDRLVVGAYAGMEPLGYYAFAVSISGLTASLAWVIRTVVLPDVYASVRSEGTSSALRDHLERIILPFSRIYPVLVGVLAIAVGPAVSLVLPQYLEAVPAARVVIFAGVTAGYVSLGSLGVVAAGRQRVLPYLSLILLLMNALVSYLALRLEFGILGVAIGTLICRTLFGISIVSVNVKSAALEGASRVAFGVSIPLLWCAAVVFSLDRWLGGLDLKSAAVSLLVFLLAVSPLFPAALAGLHRGNTRDG